MFLHSIRIIRIVVFLIGFAGLSGCFAESMEDDNAKSQRDGVVVTLKPGDNLQDIISRQPAKTVFVLEPGVYRRQSVKPKNGQTFIGKPGAVLNGAMVLRDWKKEGPYWVAGGLPPQLTPHGMCRKGYSTCKFREDLFVDGKLYTRAVVRGALVGGDWFYHDRKAYLREDPAGKLVELSVTSRAFGGKAKYVTLRDIVVEKYASRSQAGAIDARRGRNWKFINVTARWNHGIGLFINRGTIVKGGFFGNNGQMGMGGEGDGVLIEDAEVAYNNYANYHYAWESGGFKFVRSEGMIIRNMCVHHNNGVGIWNDIDNINTVIEGNRVFRNARIGILQEISYSAIIRNNIVVQNASDRDPWLWGSQILIQNSQDVRVYGNTVEVAPGFGNGIGIIHQNRGDGAYGTYKSQNNMVKNNRIIHLGARGRNGMVADVESKWFFKDSNNIFDRNNYVVPDTAISHWAVNGSYFGWNATRKRGIEQNGEIQKKQARPISLSCAKQG